MTKVVTLKNEKDFAHSRFKKSFSSPNFRMRVATNTLGITRFAFIISKKVLPKVTDRNKLKRRVKAVVSKNIEKFKPLDILIFPGKSGLKQAYDSLENELSGNFKRLGLWK